MTSKINKIPQIQILLVAATLLFVLSFEFLPRKKITLVPAQFEQIGLYSDAVDGGLSSIKWIEPGKYWECDFNKSGNIFFCGMTVSFDWEGIDGRDLSSYDELQLEIETSADVKEMTVSVRNFDDDYATVGVIDSYMYNFVTLEENDLNRMITVNLEEFRVAEWWIERYDVPRQHHRPSFSNVLSMGFDISWRNPEGKQRVYVKKATVLGDLVSRATWYLVAIMFGVAIILYQAIRAAMIAHKQSIRDRRIIDKMAMVQRTLLYQNAEIEKRSTIDPLTQVYNRLGFENMLDTLRSGELAEVMGVIVIVDIDHFKAVNDHYGHAIGDKVIAQVAKTMRKNLREFDSVVRWGGEEFLLLLPNCSLENGVKTIEKIRATIELDMIDCDEPFKVTASFGATAFKAKDDFERAFDRADKALYKAKRDGRNQVVVFQEETH